MERDFSGLLSNAEQLTSLMGGIGPALELPRVDRNLRQIFEAGQQLLQHGGLGASGSQQDVNAQIEARFFRPYPSRQLEAGWTRVGRELTIHIIHAYTPSTQADWQPNQENDSKQKSQLGSSSSYIFMKILEKSILLGSKGVDLPKLAQKLESLSATATFEPLEPIQETDIQSFLRNERENAILAVLEETRKDTYDHFNKICWDSVQSDWEKNKQKILDSLGGARENLLDLTAPVIERSLIGDTLSAQSTLASDEVVYARVISEYNDVVIRGGVKPSLADKLAQAAVGFGDERLDEVWSMVRQMIDVPLVSSTGVTNSRTSVSVQNALINTARSILERRYRSHMQKEIYRNLSTARLGGSLGTLPLVKSYIATRQVARQPGLEDGTIEGQPAWAMIFFCLRCGDLEAALDAVAKGGHNLSEFARLLEELSGSNDRRLAPNTEAQVKLVYRRSIRNATDPYKRAAYCVIAACDPSEDHNEIASTTDDYLWLKLCQLRPDNEEELGASRETRFSLSYFQNLILEEYGERHFNAYKEPLLYFEVLFLTAQFEAAVEFLSRIDKWRSLAVHVALALREAKLLLLPESVQSPLVSKLPTDRVPMRRLNLARLVMLYTKKFERSDVKDALNYIFFLRDLTTTDGRKLFTVCVTEIALETRQYGQLLGRMEPDGCRSPGLIDRYQGVDVSVQEVVENVAELAESNGQFEDAVKLYDLAKKNDKVIELLIRLLASTISRPTSVDSKSAQLQRHAHTVAERLRSSRHPLPAHLSGTFYLLLDLATFFSLYHSGRVNEALDTIAQLRLVPLSPDEVESRVSTFKNLAEEVRRNIPDAIVAVMNLLLSRYKQQKSVSSPSIRRADDVTRDKFIATTRTQARSLITFTGMIPYRMPSDTTSRLVQMEIQMN